MPWPKSLTCPGPALPNLSCPGPTLPALPYTLLWLIQPYPWYMPHPSTLDLSSHRFTLPYPHSYSPPFCPPHHILPTLQLHFPWPPQDGLVFVPPPNPYSANSPCHIPPSSALSSMPILLLCSTLPCHPCPSCLDALAYPVVHAHSALMQTKNWGFIHFISPRFRGIVSSIQWNNPFCFYTDSSLIDSPYLWLWTLELYLTKS